LKGIGRAPSGRPVRAQGLALFDPFAAVLRPVAALDSVAAGGEFLKDRGYKHAWGIGRHIQGSQIFDYWRDPDGFLVEHYADGESRWREEEPLAGRDESASAAGPTPAPSARHAT